MDELVFVLFAFAYHYYEVIGLEFGLGISN